LLLATLLFIKGARNSDRIQKFVAII
jgi:hypothetical protein